MKRAAVPLAILAALLAGFAARDLVSTAQAQTPPTVVCTQVFNAAPGSANTKWESWIGEQLAAGRTHFVSHPVGVCAW